MGDEHNTHGVLKLSERVHESCLGITIQCRGRLVEDQKAGLAQERACNTDALALAAGQPAATRTGACIQSIWQSFANKISGGFLNSRK